MPQKLRPVPFQNPLRILTKISNPKISGEASRRFLSVCKKCEDKIRHIFIIHDRIIGLWNQYREYQNWMINEMTEKSGSHISTLEERERYDKFEYTILLLGLENENFFIHSRILMDDIAQLSYFLFYRKEEIESALYFNKEKKFKSFDKHKKWVNGEENINEKYKKLIQSTRWFDFSVRGFRDYYVIHSFPRPITLKTTKEGLTSKVYLSQYFNERDLDYLKKIKVKYKLKSSDNPYEILTYLDECQDIELETKEIEIITRIKREGCEMPDIQKVIDEILAFLSEYSRCFVEIINLE